MKWFGIGFLASSLIHIGILIMILATPFKQVTESIESLQSIGIIMIASGVVCAIIGFYTSDLYP